MSNHSLIAVSLLLALASSPAIAKPPGKPPGPPPVEIEGPVDANVINTPLPVVVTNPPAASVPTQHPREPVFITASLEAGVNSGGGILGNYMVPDDRRLVIEHVSFETNFVICEFTSVVRIRINSPDTGSASFHLNPLFPIPLPNSSTRFTRGSQAIKLYATPGSNVQMNWTRTEASCVATGVVAISGYLEEDLR